MKIVMTGATGFIGKAAVAHLAGLGHEITAVVRKKGSALNLPCRAAAWDSSTDHALELVPVLKGSDAVIHLAGEPIAGLRWTARTKDAIRSSRVAGTKKLIEALSLLAVENRPKTLISGSAIGYYGSRGDERLTEESSAGDDFLALLAKDWESEAVKAEKLGVRVVLLRTGIVLGRGGGALQKMKPIVFGNGAQWMSWIHLEDEVRFIGFALEKRGMAGPYNLTAPNPVRNRDFMKQLAQARKFPFVVSAPKFLLKAALGEMAAVLLASSQAVPNRAVRDGFQFLYPVLAQALDQIYRK